MMRAGTFIYEYFPLSTQKMLLHTDFPKNLLQYRIENDLCQKLGVSSRWLFQNFLGNRNKTMREVAHKMERIGSKNKGIENSH